MVTCPDPVTLVGVRDADHVPVKTEVACKRYQCDACGPGRRARVVKLIREGVRYGTAQHPGSPARLITLTYPTAIAADFGSRADMIRTSERVRRVIQRLRRGGIEIQYGRLPEATKSGRIHIHMIAWGTYVPKCSDRGRRSRGLPYGRGSGSPCYCTTKRPCLQAAAWGEGFGWADVRRVKSAASAAGYVAKYLTKQSDLAQWPKYARRFSYSREFAGGETMGSMERAWWDQILADMSPERLAQRDADKVTWIGLAHRPFLAELIPPLPRPPPLDGVLLDTGEILPIPC